MDFENKIAPGLGLYTTSELAKILRLPYHKVHRWINKYWDGELGKEYEENYSWKIEESRAVSFHSLIEFYVMAELSESGVKTRDVLNAHKILSKKYNTAFPFAQKEVLQGINTDGKKVFFKTEEGLVTLDGSFQFNLELIKVFFKKLEFGTDKLAVKLWPIGKRSSVVCDPNIQFGYPTIAGTRIYPDTIYDLHNNGESKKFIAETYDLTTKQVNDAIKYFA